MLIEFTDHPKDLYFLSNFFREFFRLYQESHLFSQTFNMFNSSGSEESAAESAKIIYYFYKCLKLKNKNFNFYEFLGSKNLIELFFGIDTFKQIFKVLVNSSDEIFNIYISAFTSIIK